MGADRGDLTVEILVKDINNGLRRQPIRGREPDSVSAALKSAMPRRNSKNWVERTMVYGIPEVLISFSWATLARK
jgi:hypothetical protein